MLASRIRKPGRVLPFPSHGTYAHHYFALQGWPSSPQEGQLLAAGGAQYLAPSSGNNAANWDSQVVHDFHAALGRSPDMAVAVAAIKVWATTRN